MPTQEKLQSGATVVQKAGQIPKTVAPVRGNIVAPATPNTVPKVPASWAALGAEAGYDPKKAEDLNFWIVGPSGEGKTTFLSSIPDQIILDFDGAARSVPGSRAIRIVIRNYEHYEEVTNKLIEEGKANKRCFHRVSTDTADEWIGMIINRLQFEKGVSDITEYGSQGHGWALIRDRCWTKLRALEEAGYVWAINGHMITKTETNPVTYKERTVVRDAIFPSMSAKIVRSSDFKLTIYSKPVIVKTPVQKRLGSGQTITQTKEEMVQKYFVNLINTAEREGKRRVHGMDTKFEIPAVNAWDLFKSKYDAAVAAAKKQYC